MFCFQFAIRVMNIMLQAPLASCLTDHFFVAVRLQSIAASDHHYYVAETAKWFGTFRKTRTIINSKWLLAGIAASVSLFPNKTSR